MKKLNKPFESSEILRRAFLRLKSSDGMTLRKWAELTSLNSATLTQIIHSKRLVPRKHLKTIGGSLNFDSLSQDYLEKTFNRDWLKQNGIKPEEAAILALEELSDVHDVIEDDAILLKSWLHLALLEFTTCENFKSDPKFLSEQFGVSRMQIQDTLADLERTGHLVRTGDSFIKKNKKMRIPTNRSRQIIRNFHMQTLEKAKWHLEKNTDRAAFEKRLILGYTVAVNPKNIPNAKLILEKALLEASSKLIRGSCTEVFQLQLQLFPLTKK